MLLIAMYPERYGAFIERTNAFALEICKAQIKAAGGMLDGMVIWGDIAYKKDMFFSPNYWRQYFQPGVKAMVDVCHEAGLPVIYHGCGNATRVYPDFIEIGIDVGGTFTDVVLLDRVADLYPTFDFQAQALVYERPLATGYVSTWHDACEEIRELAMAYDQVYDGLTDDAELVAFLSAKAREHELENPKASFADIQRNIDDRLLRDTVTNSSKIHSNYPRTDIALATISTVLAWPANRDEVIGALEENDLEERVRQTLDAV